MKLFLAGFMLFTSLSFAPSVFAGNEKGNGGGGVKVNGVYKTFYSAKVVINPEEERDLPGADLYIKTINDVLGSEPTIASQFLANALPMRDRTFYRILEDQMDESVMARLLEEYVRVTKQENSQLTIFAITDIAQKTTYLLPSFFELSEVEQAAILFHEAYWIMFPEADYAEVITAEMAFQEYVEKNLSGGYSLKLARLFDRKTQVNGITLHQAALLDAKLQNAPQIINAKRQLNMNMLEQETNMNCETTYFVTDAYEEDKYIWDIESFLTKRKGHTKNYISNFVNSRYIDLKIRKKCELPKSEINNILKLSLKYPKSIYLKELAEYLTTLGDWSTRLFEYDLTIKNVRSTEKAAREALSQLPNLMQL